ncbi:hypothetical protein [Humibacillus xanthopallidus]|uniref:hypothetical protein n=1 Tax=Humibacillus xanthopallidus TaxID=412689 RepID=UPI00163AC3AF|nr:hypothetical protein [Humibacillus xanthopallidus]
MEPLDGLHPAPGKGFAAVVPGVEQAHPGGELGRDVEDLLAVLEEPCASGRAAPWAPAQTRSGQAFA